MPLASFVDALRHSQLLELEQLDEVCRALAPTAADPQALAGELVRRSWLTAYQVEQLQAGKGAELVLGQYLVLERLGEGGMGQVYKARHRLMDRVVALKVIHPDLVSNATTVSRFRREIRAAAQLFHPNIVLAYDAAQVGASHFFVMEFVEGTDLGRLVGQRGPLPIGQACAYVRQAALGLQHAHDQGLVHRDLKPSNLLLAARGGVVKLVDLGLARLRIPEAAAEPGHPLTAEGALMGTPDFIAPEQAEDSRAVDVRSDLYSLGCTLYYLLGAQVPFPGGTWLQKVRRHQEDEPAPLEALRPDLPVELLAVLRQVMAKSPADRHQTPAELALALEPFCKHARPAAGLTMPADSASSMPSTVSTVDSAAGTPPSVVIRPRPPELPRWVVNHAGMLLVLVPAGRFLMGSPPGEDGREEDEGPQREVAITRPFYLGVFPVKQREYLPVMGKNPSLFGPDGGGGPDFPVENVSWTDAVDFCRRLSLGPGEATAGRIYRLPTEAEWEYACRAGTTSPFAFGDTLSSEQANFDGRNPYGDVEPGPYLRRTSRVGAYPDNAWGLYDLHGNVWEWCADWYRADYYQESPAEDPPGPAKGQFRVVRGGSWHFYGNECRSAYRGRGSADFRLSVGFRVAFTPPLGAPHTRAD